MSLLRVLLVEDDVDDAELVVRRVRAAGWDVSACRVDTVEALADALEKGPWDVVLSDHSVAGLTSFGALERVRLVDSCLPFVVVSGHVSETLAAETMRAGADAYLPKSELDRLGRVVDRALHDGEERRRREDAELALRESEARLRAMVEFAVDAVITMDERGTIETFNPAAEKMFGYSAADVAGQNVKVLMPEPYHSEHDGYLEHYERTGERRIIGNGREVVGRRRDGTTFPLELAVSEYHSRAGRVYTGIARDVSRRRELEAELARRALHDPLTGLPNRVLFLDRLEHSLARSARHHVGVAVFFLDLDRFKTANDTLGHAAGDEVLRITAHRLRECVRPSDTVARFGGDEFLVLCEDVVDEQQAGRIASRLAEALRTPFMVGDAELFVSASIGIAMGDDTDPETLVRNADAAMYRAKEMGKARFEVFDDALRQRGRERWDVERALHRALERSEFSLRYQPVVDAGGAGTVGFEALLRWEHPDRGLLAPDAFLDVAEETGLIVPIGAWALREAARQAASWGGASGPTMWVNLSARQLVDPGLPCTVREALSDAGLAPGAMGLEITESALMTNAAAAVATTRSLRDLGVALSIDDFGTGYSSLAYLKQFPVSALKIDRSFVDGLGRDSEDVAIVSAIISLAGSLRLAAVAEGVETHEQLEVLRDLGCEIVQGYYFARPLPPEQAELFLL